jgi:putrescine aminotransferase
MAAVETVVMLREILATPPAEVRRLHAEHINPTLAQALSLLGYGRDLVRAAGVSVWDVEGREYLDFLAGYGSLLLGHNHPEVRAALEEVLRSEAPNFLQICPQPLAVSLAQRLARIAPGGLSMAYLTSSGSEAVEGAMKLARAVTRRPRFVSAERGFHGITLGALSVTGGQKHRAPFEPLLPDCALVPWGDAGAVERELRKRDVAAVVLEPMQGEGGMRPPPAGYLAEVARHCRKYGTLLVLDEIQTGLGRTGKMFFCEHEGVEPDVLCVAKGLSGGAVPVSAYVTRRALWERAYGALQKYDVHSATFSGGALACAAALATLEIVERDRLPQRAAELGEYLGARLREVTSGHSLVREVRGRGLLWGIELGAGPQFTVELVAQWLAVGLMQRQMITQVGTQAPEVVRAEPPLIVELEHIDRFAAALRATLAEHATGALSSLSQVFATLAQGAGRAVRDRVKLALGVRQ